MSAKHTPAIDQLADELQVRYSSGVPASQRWFERRVRLAREAQAERDDLLAALEEITRVEAPTGSHAEIMAGIARAAIAEAKEATS